MTQGIEAAEKAQGAVQSFLDRIAQVEAAARPQATSIDFNQLFAWAKDPAATQEQKMMAALSFSQEADNKTWNAESGEYEFKYGPEMRAFFTDLALEANEGASRLYGGAGGAGNALGYASLAEQQRQFDEQMAFGKEREKQRIQEAMSAMKMEGAGLQTRALTDASQLVAQVAPFNIPPGMEYLPGREPGGTLSALAQMGGWNYTPERAVGTPINPNIIPQQAQMAIAQALANLGGA